ncbi:MAG TPA: hypothetical protein VNI52_02580 [Sphingobacteriaceae bacterium]|nr:hypothetical protein [Sphingobacteriaceae bacterium]
MKFIPIIKIAASCLFIISAVAVNAQKKPKDIQENSLFPSGIIKIDGKLNDWQDSLQAYNRTTSLGYTIANDEKNIYLAIRSHDPITNYKILAGGITFAINVEGKKQEKEASKVTFPILKSSPRPQIQSGQRTAGERQAGQGGQARKQMQGTDAESIEKRKQLLAQFKEIKVSGFKDITDSLISIYNEYGIKTAVSYDAKGNFIYELAVPLKSLNINIDTKKELAYNIKINGRQFRDRESGGGTNDIRRGESAEGRDRNRGNFGGNQRDENINRISFADPVDFWGKYSLARP